MGTETHKATPGCNSNSEGHVQQHVHVCLHDFQVVDIGVFTFNTLVGDTMG
jgi:hypothetical protein